MRKLGIILSVMALGVFITLFWILPNSFSQIPVGQDAGSRERSVEEVEKKESVLKKLFKGKEEAEIEEAAVEPEVPAEKVKMPETTVFIDRIDVTGVTVFSPEEIQEIVMPYEGRELSLSDFSSITDKITEEYRKNGYVTSVAYLVPQKIEGNTLRIAVLEGKVGTIDLTGNKHFSTKRLLQYIDLKKDDLFNYDVLRENINYINEHPDRNAKVVLARGEARGQTDMNIEVQDRFPYHVTLGYNNYNSHYVNRNKFLTELKCNNFLGLDHVASVEGQVGATGRFFLGSARYMIPFSSRFKMGASYIYVYQKLGGSVKDLDIIGKGHIASVYYSYKLIDTDNFTMGVSPGFEFKEIENEVLDIVISEDNMRIAKVGLDFDMSDRFHGRTILTQEFDYGIPNFMGGLKHKDPKASRVDSGGDFFRSVTNVARVQSLPLDLSLMLRGSMQFTPNILVSAEQFLIGGPTTVRGYPVAEEAGDNGIAASSELYVPPYILPQDWKVPFTETTFFDALRFVAFFDWGYIFNKDAQVGESDSETLCSVGPALRFDIPEKLSVSFDYGFGLSGEASNGTESRAYIEVKLFF